MIEIAKILKAQGIHGEVKAQLFSDNYEAFCGRGFAYVKKDGLYERIDYEPARTVPPYVFLRIKGISTRNDAEVLQGVFLYLDRKEFETPADGEYYICDLLGLTVKDEEGRKLGIIKQVLQHGAADVYVVEGDRNLMFPALKRVIRNVDLKAGVIEINAEALGEVAVYDDI